eukprot:s1775_g7.t1
MSIVDHDEADGLRQRLATLEERQDRNVGERQRDRSCAARGWQKFIEAAVAFFDTESRHEDPLVETVRQQPVAALRFMRIMLLSGSFGSLVVCALCWIFLYFFWSSSCSCQRPLRWWLLLYVTLQQLQLPVRFVTLWRINRLPLNQGNVELQAEVQRFTSSLAWRCSKNISLFTYGWFVLGIVWVLNSDFESCMETHRMTVAVIGQAFARAVGAMLCFRMCLQGDAVPEGPPKVEAARSEEIYALQVLAFRSEMAEEHATCAVCLCEYVEGEVLRRLPCGHLFHRRCADEWLQRSCRCPLCVQSIRDFI